MLKHVGQWDVLGRLFKFKGPTFERMITKYVLLVSSLLYKLLLTRITSKFTMNKLLHSDQRFYNFTEALYAVDVTFQQLYRPSGGIAEGKLYFSGKHHLYGYKEEVSVLPNNLVDHCNTQFHFLDFSFERFSSFPILLARKQ